jgi:hypothetical protein
MARMTTARKLLLGLLGGSASFDPLVIANLALWLDASDSTTLFQASNGTTPATADADPVGYWGDKSGLGRHVTQSTAGFRPLLKTAIQNGRNVLRFDGTDDYLSKAFTTSAQPQTMFLVVSQTDGAATARAVIDGKALPDQHVFQVNAAADTTLIFAGTVLSGSTTAPFSGQVFCLVFNGASSAIYRNGVSVASGAVGTQTWQDGVTLGSQANQTLFWPGDMMEIIVYNAALSPSVISSATASLITKWGAV